MRPNAAFSWAAFFPYFKRLFRIAVMQRPCSCLDVRYGHFKRT